MSEEESLVKENAASVDVSDEPAKTAPKKVSRKSAKKSRPKREDQASNNAAAGNKQNDDNFDPGDEVSFSFDPNEVNEPGDSKDSRDSSGNENQGKSQQDRNRQQDNNSNRNQNNQNNQHNQHRKGKFKKKHPKQNQQPQHPKQKQHQKRQQQQQKKGKRKAVDSIELPVVGELLEDESIKTIQDLQFLAEEGRGGGEPIKLNDYYRLPLQELVEVLEEMGVKLNSAPNRRMLLDLLIKHAVETKRQILDTGLLWVTDDDGAFIMHEHNNYVPHSQDFFFPECFIKQYGLKTGHMVDVQVLPQTGEKCGYAVDLLSVNGMPPEEIQHLTPFEDLIPYYPTERILLETHVEDLKKQDVSMRVIDALTPIGFGQRGLIVAPPRTGKTIILQGLANSLATNNPDADLIVLLIDERPEEVTDFRRMVKGEVIASTFDEAADNHVHVAEMVIEKARRMVEVGRNVIILLDSITRLARGYNTMMPNSGKILSGGVEAGALQKPKRFFGSARNIE
ncbi:MAG: transcription termination factor Rho, partial [Verrucomicrobiae bacterium]|nr:transcription termination factor Rho [Verrucomicrobiae bacterium]